MSKITKKKRILIKCHKILNLPIQCAYCNIPLIEGTNLPNAASVDHLIPQTIGGMNTYDNIVLSCEHCNIKKGDTDLEKFCETNKILVKNILNKIIQIETINSCRDSDDWDKISFLI